MNKYIQTGHLQTMDLEEPRPEDIDIRSMAKALSNMTRYNGFGGFYSVAEHLVLGARWLEHRSAVGVNVQLAYIFHDAHEVYVGDLMSPVKCLPDLREPFEALEMIHQVNVWQWLSQYADVPEWWENEIVKKMDARMCVSEARRMFGRLVGPGWPDVEPLDHLRLEFWDPGIAEGEFIAEVLRLAPSVFSRHLETK